MSEFDGIKDFDGWNAKLGELLGVAASAAQQDPLGPRLAISERLTQFVVRSTPNTPEILALDQIANAARAALLRSSIDERLVELARHQGELASLTKKLSMVAATATAEAASLRLERTNQVIASLTESVRSLNDFRTLLDGANEVQLLTSLEKLVASIQKVRNELEREA